MSDANTTIRRDSKGRLAKGSVLNPRGRELGSKDKAPIDARRLRREVIESWDRVGGSKHLDAMARTHPDRWLTLVLSVLPKQNELDLRDVTRITTAELLAKVLPRLPDSDLGRSILAALPKPQPAAGEGSVDTPVAEGSTIRAISADIEAQPVASPQLTLVDDPANVPNGSPDNGDVIDVGDDADVAIEAQPSTQVPTTPALTRDGQSASANVPPESQDDGGISRVPQITQPPSPIPTQDTD